MLSSVDEYLLEFIWDLFGAYLACYFEFSLQDASILILDDIPTDAEAKLTAGRLLVFLHSVLELALTVAASSFGSHGARAELNVDHGAMLAATQQTLDCDLAKLDNIILIRSAYALCALQ